MSDDSTKVNEIGFRLHRALEHFHEYQRTGTTLKLVYVGLAIGEARAEIERLDSPTTYYNAQRLVRHLTWAIEDMCAVLVR